ncbi:MAG: SDR family oxidoreductase [Proteobacteria bacterium]|nr:SDR family oxidoreductase [Pseudomonadota bacterium]
MKPLVDLAGHGIAVTGGGGHLGRALARGLAELGATVVVCGRRAEPLEAVVRAAADVKPPGRVVAEIADLSQPDASERVMNRVEKEAGGLAGWVNNACSGPAPAWDELDPQQVAASLQGVLGDLMIATQAAIRRMSRCGGGSIVQISSMYGVVSPQPALYEGHEALHNPPVYGAAKAGVIQFARYAACHAGPQAVRVNCVTPGPFPRPEVRRAQDFEHELARRVPLGRVGEAEELVGPVAFLLSSAASYVTGHNLVVDGGWTAW